MIFLMIFQAYSCQWSSLCKQSTQSWLPLPLPASPTLLGRHSQAGSCREHAHQALCAQVANDLEKLRSPETPKRPFPVRTNSSGRECEPACGAQHSMGTRLPLLDTFVFLLLLPSSPALTVSKQQQHPSVLLRTSP